MVQLATVGLVFFISFRAAGAGLGGRANRRSLTGNLSRHYGQKSETAVFIGLPAFAP